MHQRSVLSTYLFAVMVDVVIELAGVLTELLCADDLVQMSKIVEGHRIKFLNWKEAFKSKNKKGKLSFV